MRRSGNYKPTLWDFDRIQSLNSVYTEEKYATRASELVVVVKKLLEEESSWFGQLELIDDLQRLGLSYHFEDEIRQILSSIYLDDKYCKKMDLYSTSLCFRLLRQHGFKVSQDVFNCFKNKKGDFESSLGEDMKGLLELYEASFLLTHGEETLEQARVFSTNLLQKKLDDGEIMDEHLLNLVRHSLRLPLHWSVQRPNARWFIDACAKKRLENTNPILLELAKLDFNIVQAAHQQELKHVSRWWEESKLAEKLPFARDRVVENYIWNVGLLFEPQYGYPRIMTTKLFILITVIDDISDVYGTLEETQLFNDTIQRWDTEGLDKLPEYMQICYLALDSFIDEAAYHVLKEQGVLIIQDLRKSWADLCAAYAKEAEWYYTGYKPTLEEYMEVAWISISAHTILSYVFFLISNPIEKDAAENLRNYHNVIRCSAMVLRLADDLGTEPFEMRRGDVPKAVECYMNDTGASMEEGREYVKFMIRETWKETNEESFKEKLPFSEIFMRSAADLGRQAQYMYQHGDGHGISNREMEERILGLIFEPIV
nr:(-)-bornyl diphosphate synthase [Mentha longifolia]